MSAQDGEASRRALLTGAGASLASAAAIALGGCGRKAKTGSKAIKRAGPAVKQSDLPILESLLMLERRTVAAYTAGSPLLSRADAKTAKQFLSEELEHTGELLALIKAGGGGKGPPREASYDLGMPTDDLEVLRLLHSLERAQIVGYLNAIPRLAPGPVRAAASSILASDAQHVAVIRSSLGLVPAPSPFVTGTE